MKPIFLFILIFLLGLSCNQNRESEIPVVHISDRLFAPEELYVSDVASEMKIIQLETNDSCLVGKGRNFEWTKQGIVLDDTGLKKFDTTGRFLGDVFRFGHGPGELAAKNDYYVKDSLIFLTGLSKDLYIYTFEGSLVERFQIPVFTHNGFAALGGGKFITGTLEWGNGSKAGRLQFFDRSDVKKTLYKPYSTEGKYPESYPMGDEIKFFSYKST